MEFSATTLLLLVIFIVCLILFNYTQMWQNKAGLPPGPTPLPIIGNLFQLDMENMMKSLMKLSEKYGQVFTIYLGPQPFVVLCGYEALKEALVDQGEDFSGRGDLPVVIRFTKRNGLVLSNGERWKQLRRFAIMTLRNFGMGKRSIDERIQEEAQYLVEKVATTKEQPFDPTSFFSQASSNIICSIVFGHRYNYEDKEFGMLLNLMNDNFRLISSTCGQLYNLFPTIMKHLPGPHNRIFENFEKLKLFVLERVKMHEATLDPSSPRDFIDCFLLKIAEEKDNPEQNFQTETLVMTTHNLFFAGTETTSTTLRFGFLILLKHPEIEEKVQEEIDRVIGHDRKPQIDDRNKMPYTDAVIHEIQRFADILPMGVPHAVTRETQFRGYTIPQGTSVIPLLGSSHLDPTQFENPKAFNPGHFLDSDGNFVKKDAFVPFSLGRRVCLGEGLARKEIFLFLATILQAFALKSDVDRQEIDITPQMSALGNVPRPYKLSLVPRQ